LLRLARISHVLEQVAVRLGNRDAVIVDVDDRQTLLRDLDPLILPADAGLRRRQMVLLGPLPLVRRQCREIAVPLLLIGLGEGVAARED
jgi:hypothetical protein